MSFDSQPFGGGRGAILVGLAAGAIGAVVTGIGMVVRPGQAFFAYLTAYCYVLTVCLGALFFLMGAHAMRATWPVAVRRLAEAVVAIIPLLALLFVPLLFGLHHLYPWMRPETVTAHESQELLLHKLSYMNLPFFVVRAAVYLSVFAVSAFLLRRWSLQSDRPDAPVLTGRQQLWSAALLPPVGLAMTFASFDWLMSLSPDWYSTMFGFYVFSGAFVSGLAMLTILAASAQRHGYVPGLQRAHWYALGRLLFAFVIFWGYIAYFQFFLIWIGNKPVEAGWFADRVQGGFRVLSVALAFGMFGVPFFALLPYEIKQRSRGLVVLSVWLLLAHYLDVFWLVAPNRGPGPHVNVFDLSALLAVGGTCLAFGVWRQRGHHLVPAGDPRLARALEYRSR